MQDPIRVVVADDHPVILFGAEQALLKFQGIRVVARAKQSTELVKRPRLATCGSRTSQCLVGNMAMAYR